MAHAFNTPDRPEPFGIFSSAAWQPEGKVLHISGHTAQGADGATVGVGDMKAQTRQVLENIQAALEFAGGRMSDIVKVLVFVTDMSDLMGIHEVRAEFFERPYPASSLVQVSGLVRDDYLIEIEAVAVIPTDRARNSP
ncbi:MAG: RidA family protein [SAR202 cluster bacterium]|jgi:reactive intermediate/imine deaminase|nr:enamine deaminase RidA [Chloroflexota bacterium]MDP6422609.1 RidA family protein [SAR202 cluster bacterium]HAL48892.1 enamine deaminase RidA [Dehalococcoidia bacterium]MDP6662854.1 RidA family protein [SAR202 cluster bacterium]MDP6801100.1 RidA family protein [SAR202 cluster bacterium]|tara:strand:- start:7890 stop:8303 length:414 start_codon:yes stop_codon:yes gene_type:complete